MDPALRDQLRQWRTRLFYTVVCGIVCVVSATVLGAGYAVLVPLRATGWIAGLDQLDWSHLLLIGAGLAVIYLSGIVVLQQVIALQVRTRPGPPPPAPSSSITRVADRRQQRRR